MIPFSLRCTTCRARLLVRNSALLGQVVACPKCGSMVLIENIADAETSGKVEPPGVPNTDAPLSRRDDAVEHHAVENIGENGDDEPFDEPSSLSAIAPLARRRGTHRDVSRRFVILVSLFSSVVLLALVYLAIVYRNTQGLPQTDPPRSGRDIATGPVDGISPDERSAPQDDDATVPDKHVPAGGVSDDEAPGIVPEITSGTASDGAPDYPSNEDADGGGNNNNSSNVNSDGSDNTGGVSGETVSGPDVPDVVDPVLPELPPRIDVMQRIKLPMAGFHLDRVAFLDAIGLLSDFSGVPISMNVTRMRAHGISASEPMRVNLQDAAVIDALQATAEQNRMALELGRNMIVLSPVTRGEAVLSERRYDISDIVGSGTDRNDVSGFTAAELSLAVTRLVFPYSWREHGGEGTILHEGTVLTVTQDMPGHRETTRFLEKIRYARKLPLKTDVRETTLQSEEEGWKNVSKPITFHVYRTTPLSEILATLKRVTDLKTVVDHPALERYRLFFADLTGRVHVENGNVNEVLEKLLSSVDQFDLTFRIVDSDVIEITTLEAALEPENFSLESHDYGRRVALQPDSLSPDELADMMKDTIDPQSWGSWSRGGGAVFSDPVSRTFFVRQSQPVQRMIRAWLKSDLPEDAVGEPSVSAANP